MKRGGRARKLVAVQLYRVEVTTWRAAGRGRQATCEPQTKTFYLVSRKKVPTARLGELARSKTSPTAAVRVTQVAADEVYLDDGL